jgi:hypothetical protein
MSFQKYRLITSYQIILMIQNYILSMETFTSVNVRVIRFKIRLVRWMFQKMYVCWPNIALPKSAV